MTDNELVAYLRDSKGWPNLGDAADDLIEALVKELDDLRAQLNHQKQRCKNLSEGWSIADDGRIAAEAALKEAFEEGFLASSGDGWINNPRIETEWECSKSRAFLAKHGAKI